MASSVLALANRPREAGIGAPRTRVTLQRPFHTPDQRGGSIEMWSNVAVLEGIAGSEPPSDIWPVADGEFGRWLLCEPLDGLRRGYRALVDGETWVIDQVCYVELPVRELWLRLVRG